METTIVYWGNFGIMENKMEATVMGLYGWLSKFWVPFWVPYQVPYYNRDPKMDHNFDNHPYELQSNLFKGG